MEAKAHRYFSNNYGKKYRKIHFLEELYQQDWDKIADFNIDFITRCCKFLEISTTLVRASELQVEGKKSHLLLDICKKMNASEYLSNFGSRDYLENDKEIFDEENIEISYHEYEHQPYNQKGDTFLEYLSVLDLLFSEFKSSKKFI